MRKTQNAERDASILADYERGISAKDLMKHHGLERKTIYAIIRAQHKLRHDAPHQATKDNLRMSEREWEKGGDS